MGIGLLYQNKKLEIFDRTVASLIPPESSSFVITKDYDINISFIDIPIKFGTTFIIGNHFKSSVFSGIGLSVPVKDHTTSKTTNFRGLTPAEQGNYNFDFILLDETEITPSSNILLGSSLTFQHFSISINYFYAITATKNIFGISLDDKIDSILFFIGYNF